MGSYIVGSILDIFSNCLSTTANPEPIYVYHKMACNIYLYIDLHWNFTNNNTFIQNTVEYAKIRQYCIE